MGIGEMFDESGCSGGELRCQVLLAQGFSGDLVDLFLHLCLIQVAQGVYVLMQKNMECGTDLS